MGLLSEPSEAYAKAIEVSPNLAEIRSARIEALVRSADGVITPDARRAIEDTLKLDPEDARARFFEGLAKEQGGDRTSALAEWIELQRDVNSDEPWVSDLKKRISELEARHAEGGDIRSRIARKIESSGRVAEGAGPRG